MLSVGKSRGHMVHSLVHSPLQHYIFSHLRLTLIALPWKRNRLLFRGPLWTLIIKARSGTYAYASRKHLSASCEYHYFLEDNIYSVLFRTVVSMYYSNLIKPLKSFLKEIALCFLGPIWKAPILESEIFKFIKCQRITGRLLNTNHE
jgi:hypothetical protein